MRGALRASRPLLVATALLAAVLPAPLACCAGLPSAHGGDCCAVSAEDPEARDCCRGGDALDQRDAGPQPALARASEAPPLVAALLGPTALPAPCDPGLRSGPEPLYTLLATLLL